MTTHKILPIMATAILAGAMFFAGCEKENITHDSSQQITKTSLDVSISDEISVTNGILTFETTTSYENFIDYISSENDGFDANHFDECMNYLQTLNYTSLYQYKLLQDESIQTQLDTTYSSIFMQKILNASKLVIIGNYIYKVNMENGNVYVLELNNISDLEDLVDENTSNPNIQVFSVNDDVLEETENLRLESSSESYEMISENRCNEDGCGGGSSAKNDCNYVIANCVSGTMILNGTACLKAVASYRKYGIYFEVSASASLTPDVPSVTFGDLTIHQTIIESKTMVVNCRVKRRCRSLVTLSERTYSSTVGIYRIIYSCARPLSKIDLRVSATADFCGINWNTGIARFHKNL